jgi:hypothetical protein
VPVFLLLPVRTLAATSETLVPITFQIKNVQDNKSVFEYYDLEPVPLFQNIFKTKVPSSIFNLMQTDRRLAYAQFDRRIQAAAIVTTNDPFFTTSETNEDRQWYLAKTHIPEAWGYTRGSSSVTVAIIDTGIHASHIELNDGRIGEGFDITTNKLIPANSNSDDNGHGTAVAGVIGGIPDNQKGIAGINKNIKIMPIKALAADGTGDTSDVAAGLVWAADHGASIINLSLGGPGFGSDMTLSNAISYAYNKGSLLISAAGNDLADHGLNLDKSPIYPVCGDNGQNMIIGVAATDVNDQKASFSNFGAQCIDISAPGKRIVTSAFLPSDPADNILIYGSGTSLATPIVSGIAALVKANNPNLSNVEIRSILLKSADNIEFVNQTSCLGGSCNGFLGKGRINALSAIAPQPIANGTLMRDLSTGNIYFLLNGTKRLVSTLVFTERGFNLNNVVNDLSGQLNSYIFGPALTPSEGTLIKSPTDAQVYVINQEMKRPLTYLVFISRGYSFANIKTLPQSEVDSYALGDWYWPPDGTMVLIKGNPTVYVMDKQVRRAVTYFVFTQRKLSFSKVVNVTTNEFSHVPVPPDEFWLSPLDGTLIKSAADPGIYVIENSVKRLISYNVFVARKYKFSSVKTLPQSEVDVIANGSPLTQ